MRSKCSTFSLIRIGGAERLILDAALELGELGCKVSHLLLSKQRIFCGPYR